MARSLHYCTPDVCSPPRAPGLPNATKPPSVTVSFLPATLTITSAMPLTVHESGVPTNPTIVFLHGLGVSSWSWDIQIALLSPTFHILAIDLPGNGASALVDWVSSATTADSIASIIRTRARTGVAHIVGLSLGGYVALHLLSRSPSTALSVIVSGVSTRPLRHGWLIKWMLPLVPYTYRWDYMMRASARALKLAEEDVQRAVDDCRRLSAQTITRLFTEIIDGAVPDGLEVRCPMLVAAGGGEGEQVQMGLTDLAERGEMGVGVRVPEVGHAWSAERPELFAEMVRMWIEGRKVPEGVVVVAGEGKIAVEE